MNKKIYKKWWFWVIVAIAIVIINDVFINPEGKVKTEEQKQVKIEETKENDKKDMAIDSSDLKQELEHNLTTIDLDYVEVVKDNDSSLELNVAYKDEVLSEGTVTAITKLTEKVFAKKYKDIKLKIIQENPFDFVIYKYNDEKWSRQS